MIEAACPRVATGVCSMGRKSRTSELTMIKLRTPDTISVLRSPLHVMTSMKRIGRDSANICNVYSNVLH